MSIPFSYQYYFQFIENAGQNRIVSNLGKVSFQLFRFSPNSFKQAVNRFQACLRLLLALAGKSRAIRINHFQKLGLAKVYNVRNPLPFMDLQDVQELTNFFERRVSAYQVGVEGDVSFDESF